MATSRGTLNRELAVLTAHEGMDITGALKVETNDGTIIEERGLPVEEEPGAIVEDGILPKALIAGMPPKAPLSGEEALYDALRKETTGPNSG